MKRRYTTVLLALMVAPAWPAAAAAPSSPAPTTAPAVITSAAPTTPSASFGEWNVQGSNFVMNWTTGDFSSPTRVTMTRPGNSITADKLTGNEKRKTALLEGNVVLHDDRGSLTSFTPGSNGGPATISCDRLSVDGVSKIYTADGNVHFVQNGRQAFADHAIMNGNTHVLELHGHVRLIS